MTITICGSMAFAKKMKKVRKALEQKGHKIFAPVFTEDWASGKLQKRKNEDGLKRSYDLIRDYYRKIKKSNAILVLNYDKGGVKGYIGGNTFLEMGFAHVLNKKIFLWQDIPKTDLYLDEIRAMKPVVINEDLEKIK